MTEFARTASLLDWMPMWRKPVFLPSASSSTLWPETLQPYTSTLALSLLWTDILSWNSKILKKCHGTSRTVKSSNLCLIEATNSGDIPESNQNPSFCCHHKCLPGSAQHFLEQIENGGWWCPFRARACWAHALEAAAGQASKKLDTWSPGWWHPWKTVPLSCFLQVMFWSHKCCVN